MREKQDVAVEGAGACDNPINSRAHLLGRLPTGTSVAEDQPARLDLVNFLGRFSLVFAVVPLHQVMVDDMFWPKPANSQVSCARCIGLQRARPEKFLARTGRIRSASRRPWSVKGMSVVPVCLP